ncbi:uncharacterized protein LOC117907615 [Vitis riparia]|uniref:uncharacterized protein LOC117907615 n=1 Tax=Vitis riparia TaxID=96939 RepID=UPI00155AA67D|nr:uncharacterized protein LOC117907615 [Vitis riparia]
MTPTGHENKPQKDDLLSQFQNYSVSCFSVSHTSHSMLLSLETLNRALGFSEHAELVLVLPTNIMTLSWDEEPITPELDWRRPSSVSIPNQESIRWGLLIGNGRITDKIGFRDVVGSANHVAPEVLRRNNGKEMGCLECWSHFICSSKWDTSILGCLHNCQPVDHSMGHHFVGVVSSISLRS